MTMTRARFLAAIAAACLFAGTFSSGAVQLTHDGKSDYVIVLADDAPAPERSAAHELADHLRQITGAEFPIITESDLAGGDAPRILVGQSKLTRQLLPDLKWESLAQDGIVMKTVGGTLILA